LQRVVYGLSGLSLNFYGRTNMNKRVREFIVDFLLFCMLLGIIVALWFLATWLGIITIL